MDITVFLMVLGAALLHAVWNAIVKIQGDRLRSEERLVGKECRSRWSPAD